MDLYWKTAAAFLISIILGYTLQKGDKTVSLLLSVAICIMGGIVIISFVKPVLDLFAQLEVLSGMDHKLSAILLKILGISSVGEIIGLLCSDSGNSSSAKIFQLLTNSVILWLSIPVVNHFIELLKQILGAI